MHTWLIIKMGTHSNILDFSHCRLQANEHQDANYTYHSVTSAV